MLGSMRTLRTLWKADDNEGERTVRRIRALSNGYAEQKRMTENKLDLIALLGFSELCTDSLGC